MEGIDVQLPDGNHRAFAIEDASLILKGMIEQWAPARLRDPIVLIIPNSGEEIFASGDVVLEQLGIHIDLTLVLPDAVLVDVGRTPEEYWIIEAVTVDGLVNSGPIDETRKSQLRSWALDQYIDPDQCRFLSAFTSRDDQAARRHLQHIAAGTYTWFADELGPEVASHESPLSTTDAVRARNSASTGEESVHIVKKAFATRKGRYERARSQFPVGARVRDDDGDQGMVLVLDSNGDIHIDWERAGIGIWTIYEAEGLEVVDRPG